MAEAILGRGRRQFPDPRHALQSRHDPEDAARPAACRRSAIRPSATRSRSTRARRNSTAASSRGTTAWCSASSSTSTRERFYDEGEDIWPKRYAIWGRLVAAQPDQIAYIIFDCQRRATASCRRCFRRSRRGTHRASSPASSSSIRRRWKRPSTDFNAAVRPGTFDHTILDDCRTEGLDAAEDALGAADRDAPYLCLSGAARHHLHLSRHAREQAGAHADARRQARRPTCSPPARSWPAMCSARATRPASA